jgi:hypothetical protein
MTDKSLRMASRSLAPSRSSCARRAGYTLFLQTCCVTVHNPTAANTFPSPTEISLHGSGTRTTARSLLRTVSTYCIICKSSMVSRSGSPNLVRGLALAKSTRPIPDWRTSARWLCCERQKGICDRSHIPSSESMFKTLKCRAAYPFEAFNTMLDTLNWVAKLARSYNHEDCHSAIRLVTPAQRHANLATDILNRRTILHQARASFIRCAEKASHATGSALTLCT